MVQSIRYVRDAYGFYRNLRERFGDPITIPTLKGKMIVTGDPEGVKEIFVAPPETYAEWRVGAIEPFLGPGSVFLQSGELHASRRRLMMPMFYGERMRMYGPMFQEIARSQGALVAHGQAVSMETLSQSITREVMVRAVFGITDPVEIARWSSVVETFVEVASAGMLVMFVPALRHEFGGMGPWARFKQIRKQYDDMVDAEVAARRDAPGGEDIMSLLLAARFEDGQPMSPGELRDQLVSILVAGYETTAQVFTWALHWLGRHPEVVDRLREEITALGDDPDPHAIAQLPYLEAVCHETLRLYPILPDVPRWLRKPMTLRGYDLPAGVAVAAATVLVHYDPAIYPEPDTFRPERFIERPPSPFTFLAFGGGSRRCLGAAFAMYELKIVLATLVMAYDLEPVSLEPVRLVRRNMTIGPAGGVPMRLLKRTVMAQR